ncbi:MAG TPA: hypothetical protein VGC94_00980 [Amnibacterium sp.]
MTEQKDRGAALIIVIGIGLVMVLLITTGLSVALSGMRQASSEADHDAALDAAYAGVQDYLARVNADSSYTSYGNPASTFSATSSIKLPKTTNAAFNVKAGQAWAAVPGSNNRASFRYEVDTSVYKTTGVVRIRATGRVGTTTRTVLSNIRVRGFVDYIYFTDYELQDPKLTGKPATCVMHAWEGRAPSCGVIQFAKTDHLNGPVHSNDTLVICGSTFDSAVTTANTGNPIYTIPSGCSAAKFGPGSITRAATLPMPQTNSAMQAETRSDLTNGPGCLYTGPTQVKYNANGTMTVVSPWTRYTNITATSGSDPAECGSVSGLHSAQGATVPQLDANLLYVQNVPSDPADPNYSSTDTTSLPPGLECLGTDGSTVLADSNASSGWRYNGVQYPAPGEAPASGWYLNGTDSTKWDTTTPAYGCRSGDLFVSGSVSVQTTAASENYVYVTADVRDVDKNSDVLGLVGQNGVLVYNPLSSLQVPLNLAGNREIDAAIVSVAHTFQVQNFDRGPARGTLTVFGSLAQKFRGPVATSANGVIITGYAKNYAYDPLLVAVTPPKFLEPSATSFILVRYASVDNAFDASGAPQ